MKKIMLIFVLVIASLTQSVADNASQLKKGDCYEINTFIVNTPNYKEYISIIVTKNNVTIDSNGQYFEYWDVKSFERKNGYIIVSLTNCKNNTGQKMEDVILSFNNQNLKIGEFINIKL